MVSLASLWGPILLSAVLVFVASAILHMVLPFHRKDFRKLPSEAQAMDALRGLNIPAGDYMVPCGEGPSSMKDPAFIEKMTKGPVAIMTVMPPGVPTITTNLVQWFVYTVVVSLVAGYVAGRALGPGAHYLDVFRFAGTVAFASYSLGLWQDSIWYKRAWGTTIRNTVDGLIYALLTAGTFGWLWPR
jgi:hypothetical protein